MGKIHGQEARQSIQHIEDITAVVDDRRKIAGPAIAASFASEIDETSNRLRQRLGIGCLMLPNHRDFGTPNDIYLGTA